MGHGREQPGSPRAGRASQCGAGGGGPAPLHGRPTLQTLSAVSSRALSSQALWPSNLSSRIIAARLEADSEQPRAASPSGAGEGRPLRSRTVPSWRALATRTAGRGAGAACKTCHCLISGGSCADGQQLLPIRARGRWAPGGSSAPSRFSGRLRGESGNPWQPRAARRGQCACASAAARIAEKLGKEDGWGRRVGAATPQADTRGLYPVTPATGPQRGLLQKCLQWGF